MEFLILELTAPRWPVRRRLLAQNGHVGAARRCLLLKVKRTSDRRLFRSAFDPKRTSQ
jgi:hypothetical protein